MADKKYKVLGLIMVFLLLVSACSPLAVEPTKSPPESPVTTEPPKPTPTTEQTQPPAPRPAPGDILLISEVSRESQPAVDSTVLDALVAGNTAFAFDLYQNLRQASSDNLFYSPYSISLALAMTYAGARGETEKQMANTFHFNLEQARLHPAFNALDLQLHAQPPADEDGVFQLNIANSIWGQKDYPFLQEFLDTLARNYGAGMYIVDYNQPEQARGLINDWVAKNTEDKIRDLIPQGALTPLTRLVLANAIYFKAAWEFQFDPNATRPDDFTLLDGSVIQTPMMYLSKFLSYAKDEDFEALVLPYKNSSMSMLILLPDEGKFDLIEKSLSTDLLEKTLNQMQMVQVNLSMPKFKIESSFGLADTLAAMGMKDAFDADTADFTGMTEVRELFISDVVHKAFVDVNEEGTEAAAATAVIIGVESAPSEEVDFKVDRPFIFLIMDSATGTVLFMGRVVNPAAH